MWKPILVIKKRPKGQKGAEEDFIILIIKENSIERTKGIRAGDQNDR